MNELPLMVQLVNKGIDCSDRIIFPDVVIEVPRKHGALSPTFTLDKSSHEIPRQADQSRLPWCYGTLIAKLRI
jgi:hypothetical protein